LAKLVQYVRSLELTLLSGTVKGLAGKMWGWNIRKISSAWHTPRPWKQIQLKWFESLKCCSVFKQILMCNCSRHQPIYSLLQYYGYRQFCEQLIRIFNMFGIRN
jgi:hypothetical protein